MPAVSFDLVRRRSLASENRKKLAENEEVNKDGGVMISAAKRQIAA